MGLRWLSFTLTLRRGNGPNPFFEVFDFRRRKVHKLETDIKLVSALLRSLIVGNDVGLDFQGRPAAGGGDLDHQNRSSIGVVVQKEMMPPDQEFVRLQAGPFDGKRGETALGSIGQGFSVDRVPDVKLHFRINRVAGIAPALLAQEFPQCFHSPGVDWGENLPRRVKVSVRAIDPASGLCNFY